MFCVELKVFLHLADHGGSMGGRMGESFMGGNVGEYFVEVQKGRSFVGENSVGCDRQYHIH